MMVMRFQRVTPIVSHHLTRPADLEETHAKPSETTTRKPDYHR